MALRATPEDEKEGTLDLRLVAMQIGQ